ncbi:MAG TPA: hypothetical protein VN920_04730 [Pyrinomonadaceae bacterium]|nr:hypothetical protein [Pyrinomonadaceae bacterium]
MRSSIFRPPALFCLAATLLLVVMASGCRPASETNTNSNVNLSANANTSPANLNTNNAPASLAGVNTREPVKYRATLVFSAETAGGEKTIGMPTVSADVARNGDDRRLSFKLPDGSDLIYIDHDNHNYAIVPSRKQYAELTKEAVGFQIQKLMTPGQLVSYVSKLKGLERVGDEQVNGRTADKYRYTTTVKTGTQAGEIKNEAFVFVDKDTGLPLRAELFAESSGSVKGLNSAKIVAEMRNISTDVNPSLFTVPEGFNKIPAEQIRAQIDAVTSTAAAVIKALLTNLNSSAPPASPSPTVSPSAPGNR